jgi:ABC-type Mn2+/Zn2+ transport system ATPase subunit
LDAFCLHFTLKQHIIDTIGLNNLAKHLHDLKIPLSTLNLFPQEASIGQLKRITILIAMLSPNNIIVLDECLASLDQHTQRQTLQWIKANLGDKAVLIIHHHVLPESFIDQAIMIHQPKQPKQQPVQQITSKPLILIHHLQTPSPILIQSPLCLYKGGCSILTGESGSGKSSLLKALMLNDFCHIESNVHDFRSKSQLVFQDAFSAFIAQKSVQDTFNMPDIDSDICQHILNRFGINLLHLSIFKHCSGGCLQVLQLARALARKPKILLLDEPTSAMHLEWRNITYQLLTEQMAQGLSILMVTHDPHEVKELASHHYALHRNNQRGYTCISLS